MIEIISRPRYIFFFKTEETVDAQWFTYYYDSATKELKKWEYTQAEPPQIPKENE